MRHQTKEFRASLLVRAAAICALLIWVLVGLYAASLEGIPHHIFASIAFFVAFFVVCVTYYSNMAYVVHEYGVTYRGATEFDHFDWEDIVQVDNPTHPLGGYYVITTHGVFVLNYFIRGHQALAELIIARAGLMPTRA